MTKGLRSRGRRALQAAVRAVSAAVGGLSCRRSRTTLGLLLVLVLAAGGNGLVVAANGAAVARAEAVEAGALLGLEIGDPVRARSAPGIGLDLANEQPRSVPRWLDPTAGGRPPARAPDAA